MSNNLHAELLLRGIKLDSRVILPGDTEPTSLHRDAEQRRILAELQRESRLTAISKSKRPTMVQRLLRSGSRAQ